MRWILAATLLLTLAFANPADLLRQGDFQAAYRSGLEAGDAQSYVLAARAASFYAMYQAKDDRDRADWFAKAEAAAKKAIELDSQNAEGYFELARALGRLAQYRGILQSLSLASAVRDNLEKALERNPDHAGARVALALWNLELSQKGVGWLYGASIGRVVPLFEKAIRLEPEEIIHRTEFARALLRLGQRDLALEQLRVALKLKAKDARDRYEQAWAEQKLQELEQR